MTDDLAPNRNVLHILVVGFHHKKGQQVEFCHPAWSASVTDECSNTTDANTIECPQQWRHLPSLAIPDGVHNSARDCVYFSVPALSECERWPLSCVACFRQVDSNTLLVKTDDITRSSVQKSVVVISRLPLFGYIQSLLDPLVDEYIRCGDFTKVDILRCSYSWLNQMVTSDLLLTSHVYYGLSVKSFVLKFGHLSLQLLKLVLLERRVLISDQSAGTLSKLLLTLVSILPAIFDQSDDYPVISDSQGAGDLGVVTDSRSGALIITDSQNGTNSQNIGDLHAERDLKTTGESQPTGDLRETTRDPQTSQGLHTTYNSHKKTNYHTDILASDHNTNQHLLESVADSSADRSTISTALSAAELADADLSSSCANTSHGGTGCSTQSSGGRSAILSDWLSPRPLDVAPPASTDVATELLHRVLSRAQKCAGLDKRRCGMPLLVFTQGYLLRPYLSLNEIELLEDASLRAILAGAANSLFALKTHLLDAYVTLEPQPQLQLMDDQLRRQLALSTEDLRFAELLLRLADSCRCVGGNSTASTPCQCETTLRNMFCLYVYSLLRCSLTQNQDESTVGSSAFNNCYVEAFRRCHSYRQWLHLPHDEIFEVNPGHPCSGQLTVQDVRLRISHTMQSTEQMRKVSSVAAATGRAVGGALSAARGSLNNWWNSKSTANNTGHG